MREAMAGSFALQVARITRWCVFATIGLGAVPAQASDIELGRYLSSECVTCHGAARAGGQIPEIFGMAESTFEQVIKAYRNKQLPNEVMQTVTARLKDDEIAALATYFAKTKKPH